MKRQKFVQNIAARTGYTKENIERMVVAFEEEVISLLLSGDKVMLKGFMIIESVIKPARKGIHPTTHEVVDYPEKRMGRIRLSKEIKKKIGEIHE